MAIGVVGNDETNKLFKKNDNNKYYDASFEINLDDKNECHAIICSNVRLNSIVLDIGCAQGMIGKALKEKLNCTIYGIDANKEAINQAKKNNCYEKLYIMDITNKNDKSYKEFMKEKIKFDYIIFSDVLEHLVTPADVLFAFGAKLKNNGKILISLPNIAHYDIIDGLLNEKFNYSLMGLLDNTHLRFFTKYSFAEYIADANKYEDFIFDCKLIGQTIIPPRFMESYSYLNNIILKNKDLIVLQNIFLLDKLLKGKKTVNLSKILNEKRINITDQINSELKSNSESQLKLEEKYNELKNNFDTLLSKDNNLESDYSELNRKYDSLNDDFNKINAQYNEIINCRCWKILMIFRKIENFFLFKKNKK